ncbi:hypothetical protein Fmac_013223 [Flemingia macrophylla]|uniref:Uncharacterized protein n=1 Tax=Flemingia macrophylla TaxID=520843 RepID=A0ABD1MTE0_9FABA
MLHTSQTSGESKGYHFTHPNIVNSMSASQIAFGYGGESTSMKLFSIPRGTDINQNSAFNRSRKRKNTKNNG